jgi:hypothetical protein
MCSPSCTLEKAVQAYVAADAPHVKVLQHVLAEGPSLNVMSTPLEVLPWRVSPTLSNLYVDKLTVSPTVKWRLFPLLISLKLFIYLQSPEGSTDAAFVQSPDK